MANTRSIPTSKPADLVTFTIKVNGTPISRAYNVLSIVVRKEVNKIPTSTLVIADGDASQESFDASSGEDFVFGNEIEILAGYHSDETTIFKGIVISQRLSIRSGKAAVLKVVCKDEAIKMTIGKKSAFFSELPDSDVINEIVGNYALAIEADDTEVVHQALIQHHTSDWDFMLMRAEVNGLLVHVSDGAIQVLKPAVESEGVLTIQYGATMYEFDAEIDARHQYKKVVAQAWDHSNQEVVTAEAVDPGLTEAGNITTEELADVIGLEQYDMIHTGALPDQELQAWADAKWLKSKLAKVKGTVKFQGIGTLNTGDTITLQGVGERFEGPVFVSGFSHEIGDGDWKTTVQFGLNPSWFAQRIQSSSANTYHSLLPCTQGLYVGTVTQLQDDPDSAYRVLVKIPLLQPNEEGVWARVASIDAGNNRGMFFRPEINDEVVIGFFADDPRTPVILGMLNSAAMPAPFEPSDDNHEKGLVTRSEMKMAFDDDKVLFKLETPSGKIHHFG